MSEAVACPMNCDPKYNLLALFDDSSKYRICISICFENVTLLKLSSKHETNFGGNLGPLGDNSFMKAIIDHISKLTCTHGKFMSYRAVWKHCLKQSFLVSRTVH